MSERTILVTGGGNGIGRGTLLHFHGLGWRVVALDRDGEALAELAAMLPADRCLTIAADCGQEADVVAAFGQVEGWLGDDPLTCLVNNAGPATPYCDRLEQLTLADWRRGLDTSLTATFLCSREALPLLRRGPGASIVNISSTRALQSEPHSFVYAAAKGGIDALTHAMAVSLGPEVRVNAVLPGWIETGPWQKAAQREEPEHGEADRNQHPVGRVGEVADIAQAIEYLAGAGFVTGQQLVVDGGMTRRMIYA